MKARLAKSDWILLALSFAEGAPMSPVQLQKSIFLFKKRLVGANIPKKFYKFVPYSYGPFCQEIYADARGLELEGLISIDEGANHIRQYSATPAGRSKAIDLAKGISPRGISHGKEIVSWVKAQSFRELVSAIYQKYPRCMANSIFKG